MRAYVLCLMAGVLLVATASLGAHHSASSFWYTDRTVEIEGVVKSVRMVNPHPELVIEVTEPNGEKSDWYISGGGNASAMVRAGWTEDSLPAGTRVTVSGNPSRREGSKALLSGCVTTADGHQFNFSSGSEQSGVNVCRQINF